MSLTVSQRYADAKARYAELGVDTDAAIAAVLAKPLSLHCWQGDDVGGFETPDASLSGGGIQVTGNHPGRARTPDELRADLEAVMRLLPGRHRVNLHAIYGDFGNKFIERDAIEPAHFARWMDWAKSLDIALDFNSTLFGHPKAADGFTLSHRDASVRDFWIEHVARCRVIGEAMGRAQNSPCIHNIWAPDGDKDFNVSRLLHRRWLTASLDNIFATEHDPAYLTDSVESKLFGIGSEAFVVGSHDFYLAYAQSRGRMLCVDMGHYHPTESVADKISSLLPFVDQLLIHVSRPMRWDSDHVVILNDELKAVMEEIVRADALARVHLALDFFDGSINRIGAYVIGVRASQKALLQALLEPTATIRDAEAKGDGFARLALLDERATLPFAAVWDMLCERAEVARDGQWLADVAAYERAILAKRG